MWMLISTTKSLMMHQKALLFEGETAVGECVRTGNFLPTTSIRAPIMLGGEVFDELFGSCLL